jgi:ferric-dicitrate binding protein FerR (iron transport regulator)
VRELLADLGRWYDLSITLSDSTIMTHRVTATFGFESLDQVSVELAALLDADVDRHGKALVIRPHTSSRIPSR